jgi:putative ABC transport system permease protein
MMTALSDVWKEAWRITSRNRLNSFLAVLILAAGFGGCVFSIGMRAAFSFNESSPIPIDLYRFGEVATGDNMGGFRGRDALSLREMNLPELAHLVLTRPAAFNVHQGGSANVVPDTATAPDAPVQPRSFNADGAWVDGPLFAQLGWKMALGRDFTDSDFAAGAGASSGVILGEQLWRTQFAANPNVLGQRLMVDGTVHTVVGVLPPELVFPYREQLYVPFRLTASSGLIGRMFGVYAKLAPAQLPAVKAALATRQTLRERSVGVAAKAAPFGVLNFSKSLVTGETKLVFSMLTLIGWLVLLLAAVNVGGLLLVHWLSRTQDIATRSALGSSRARLAAAAVLQAVLLVILALALTLTVLRYTMPLFENFLHTSKASGVPSYIHFHFRWHMLLPMLLASAVTIFFMAAPVLMHLRNYNLMRELRGAERGNSGPGKLGLALLFAQCFLSVAAVLIAVICARGASTAMTRNYGISAPNTLVAQIRSSDGSAQSEAALKLIDAIRAQPEVVALSVSVGIPQVFTANRDLIIGEERSDINFVPCDDAFAGLYGIKLRSGRWLNSSDIGKAVAVLDPAAAQAAFATGAAQAIGKVVKYFDFDGKTELSATVIGITEPVTLDFEQGPDKPSMFVPMQLNNVNGVTFAIRTRGNPSLFVPKLEQLGANADARVALFGVRTYAQAFQEYSGSFRLLSSLFAPMGLLALVLAAVGLSALFGSLVAKRMRQSAIRRALGAGFMGVVLPLLNPLLLSAVAGLSAGSLLAWRLGTVMSQALYDSSLALSSVLGTLAVVLAALALACVGPARRALRVSPTIVLKQQ